MKRPSHETTPDGVFTSGTGPDSASVLTSSWLNTVLEEMVGVVEGAGLTLDPANDLQILEAVRTITRAAQPAGARTNLLVNGNFDLWQFLPTSILGGTGALPAGPQGHSTNVYYVCDGWYYDNGGDAGHIPSRVAFSPSQTDVPGSPSYFLRIQHQGGTATNQPWLGSAVEDVRLFDNRTVTLSIWLKADDNTDADVRMVQAFGPASSSTDVDTLSQTFQVSNTWAEYVFTFELPSIAGKDIQDESHARFEIRIPQNEAVTIDVARAQLEYGNQSTPFDAIPIEETLKRCQRYTEHSWEGAAAIDDLTFPLHEGASMAWAGNVTEVAGLSTRYRVPKLRAPHLSHHNLGAVQWYSPQTGTLDTLRLLGSGADGAIPSSNATVAPSGVATGRPTLSSAPGAAQNVAAHWQVCVPLTI